jgi:hypothetical protein
MKKDWIPFELALELKQLGFDETCLRFYLMYLPAPTYSQAFRWFREKSLLEGVVEQANDFYWYKFSVYLYGKEGKHQISNGLEFDTYEEAELACLKKLIDIAKAPNI